MSLTKTRSYRPSGCYVVTQPFTYKYKTYSKEDFICSSDVDLDSLFALWVEEKIELMAYDEASLKKKSLTDLKEIGRLFGVRGASKKSLIEGILNEQNKNNQTV